MQIIKSTRNIDVSSEDLQAVIAELALEAPEQFAILRPILSELMRYLSEEVKQPNKFGWNHAQVVGPLPAVPEFDRALVEQTLSPNLDFLNTTKEHGVDLKDSSSEIRKRFSEKDSSQAEQAAKEVTKQWLLEFLDVLAEGRGHLRINHGVLKLTLLDRRMANVAAAAKANIFMDATATREDPAKGLGISPDEILHIQQAVPENNNLEIVQVATMGRMGMNRGKDQQRRVEALINHVLTHEDPGAKIIDFKRFTGDGDGKGKWWIDSRGSNDFETINTLILAGTPCRNLGDLEAEFTVLYGRVPQEGTEKVKHPIQVNNSIPDGYQPYFEMEDSADEEFREFVRRHTLADIRQAIGRLRDHRRPEEKLRVYFIGDYPLDIPVTLKQAFDISSEAGTRTQMLQAAIFSHAKNWKAQGIVKITQKAIAEATGRTQGRISQFASKFFNGWAHFKKLLMSLLENSDPEDDASLSPEERWVAHEYIPLLLGEPDPLLNGIIPLIEGYGWSSWARIAQKLSATTRIALLKELLPCLPLAWQHGLITALEAR